MEVDLRYSKDGHIVLHHDSTLDRTTTGSGPVKGLTLNELRNLRLKDKEGIVTNLSIQTIEEVIEWARGKTILILDRKGEVKMRFEGDVLPKKVARTLRGLVPKRTMPKD